MLDMLENDSGWRNGLYPKTDIKWTLWAMAEQNTFIKW